MSSQLKGTITTTSLPFDETTTRSITIYKPPQSPTSIVYTGDGQLIPQWALSLEDANHFTTMLIGVHRLDDESARLAEYVPIFSEEEFKTHEHFFVHDVRNWVAATYDLNFPKERTAIFGVSAGAELALALGLKYRDAHGCILGASPGAGYRPPAQEILEGKRLRVYLVAGRQEPFFMENAQRWDDALGKACGEVVFTKRDGEHGGGFWKDEFPLMVKWAFGDDT